MIEVLQKEFDLLQFDLNQDEDIQKQKVKN